VLGELREVLVTLRPSEKNNKRDLYAFLCKNTTIEHFKKKVFCVLNDRALGNQVPVVQNICCLNMVPCGPSVIINYLTDISPLGPPLTLIVLEAADGMRR